MLILIFRLKHPTEILIDIQERCLVNQKIKIINLSPGIRYYGSSFNYSIGLFKISNCVCAERSYDKCSFVLENMALFNLDGL